MALAVADALDKAEKLRQESRWAEADALLNDILQHDPENRPARALKPQTLVMLGRTEEAIAAFEALIAEVPQSAPLWTDYGHALRAARRREDCIAAYRKSVSLNPEFGRAWWNLASLKTFRLAHSDIETMRNQVARADLAPEDRSYLRLALGKALEDEGLYAESFEQYRKGNLIRRAAIRYSPDAFSEYVRQSKSLFTRAFFEARNGSGCSSPDPVFIVGLPRSGSTLVEQILSSHSAIEGTMELPEIRSIAGRIGAGPGGGAQPLAALTRTELKSLGAEYLVRVRIHRQLGRPFFVDKMPGNFWHIGFIHLILPNAKIIDTRRHPLGCCLSCYKNHFASGVSYSYDLNDLGRYYRDYVELMAHFDAVLPGRVHRICHENLVRNPDREIRRLLDYCGLAFEESCLRFHETDRGVYTMSSEQVRRPMDAEAIEQWRHYEPWLGPLKRALGPVLTAYPAVPEF